jgi:antitoxin component HigA of HigAB toxin-antitoxin module
MRSTDKPSHPFAKLPRDYVALCRLHLPRPIHDQADYDNTAEIAAYFAGFEAKMNADQHDYFELLATLMEVWEITAVPAKKRTPLELLQHLVEQHEMNGAALSKVLGCSQKLGPMILRGDRSITAEHARSLGRHFDLPAGIFIE